MKSSTDANVRIDPQFSRPAQVVLDGLTNIGHAVLVVTGLVTIFAGFVWERLVVRCGRRFKTALK
jgi:hypothetical protein